LNKLWEIWFLKVFMKYVIWARGSVVGWGHYATSRKVAGPNPHEITGFLKWPNPSSRSIALGSTQPLKEISTRIYLGVQGGRRVRPTTSLPSVSRLPRICELRRLTTLWTSTAYYRDNFTFYFSLTMFCHLYIIYIYLTISQYFNFLNYIRV
jgi:hypothetical protein